MNATAAEVPKLRRKDSSERVRSLPKTLLGRRSGDGESLNLVPIGPAILERIAKIQIYKRTHNFRIIFAIGRLYV